MKKALWLLALVACAPAANAYIELFLVPDDGTHGIVDGPNRWNGEEIDLLTDFLGTSNQPGPVGPLSVPAPLAAYFLYAKFVNEDPYAQIYGMNIAAGWDPGVNVERNLLYRHAKRNGPPPQHWDRWDGDQQMPLVNGTAVAVTANGIVFFQPGDVSYDLFTPDNGTALLGAVEVGADDFGTFFLGIGKFGLVVHDTIHNEPTKTYFPEVRFNGYVVQEEQFSTQGSPEFVSMAPGILFPEPAGILLLALASTFMRRR